MKRTHKPDATPLRAREYQKMDGDLLASIVETFEALAVQGLVLPQSMTDVIEKRQSIKLKYKKP